MMPEENSLIKAAMPRQATAAIFRRDSPVGTALKRLRPEKMWMEEMEMPMMGAVPVARAAPKMPIFRG